MGRVHPSKDQSFQEELRRVWIFPKELQNRGSVPVFVLGRVGIADVVWVWGLRSSSVAVLSSFVV